MIAHAHLLLLLVGWWYGGGGIRRTWICHGHGGDLLVAQPSAGRGHGEEDDGAEGADDARVEVGRALAGGPVEVAEGTGPEARAWAGHLFCVLAYWVSADAMGGREGGDWALLVTCLLDGDC